MLVAGVGWVWDRDYTGASSWGWLGLGPRLHRCYYLELVGSGTETTPVLVAGVGWVWDRTTLVLVAGVGWVWDRDYTGASSWGWLGLGPRLHRC